MRRRDVWGVLAVVCFTAALIAFRYVYIEPRQWGTVCVSAAPPFACVPRGFIISLQRFHVWGTGSLVLGLWAFAWRGPFVAMLAAILLGIGGVENYNATWGAVGAALGFWTWLVPGPEKQRI